jgi:hypothetical protein
MDCKYEARVSLAWADSYEDAEDCESEYREDDDETIQILDDAHELWTAMFKSWAEAGAHPQFDSMTS